MPVASKPMNPASTTPAATVRHTQRVAVLKHPNVRRVPPSLLGASQSSGTPPSSGTQTPSQWPSPMMAASSTRSSLGPHEEPPALRFADAETASQSTTEAQPAKYVYRFDPYKWNPLKVAKGSDAVVLIKTRMPPVEVFDACGKTPQPSDYLPSCAERSHQELVDAARRMESVDSAFVHGVAKDGKASFVQGQSGYTATAEVHRGVFAVLAPEVPIALPTIHEVRVHGGGNTARTSRGHSAASQQHHQNGPVRRAHTGLLHSAAPRDAVDALVHVTHQRAYYGVGVVYTAHTPRAIRELAVFELVMAFYRNGVRTGRPFAPMTVELAKSEQIAKQMDARPF